MHEIFIYSGIENGDYTGSKHYRPTVYKLNVISQCSSVTPYLVLFSFFYRDYSFTQLIQKQTGYLFCPLQTRNLHCRCKDIRKKLF